MPYRIKALCAAHGVSYIELATALDISKTACSDLLNKAIWPKRRERADIEQAAQDFMQNHGVGKRELANLWQHDQNGSPDKILRSMTMLTPEILEKVGLAKDPFNAEMTSLFDLFLPKQHTTVLTKMMDAAKNCKFIAVTGSVGSGKTILKQAFMERLRDQRNYLVCEPEIIDMPRCIPATIIDAMLEDFMFLRSNTDSFKHIARKGSNRQKGNLEERSRWIHSLLKVKVKDGKKLVLMIDEAHLLPTHTLKTLKRFHEMQDGFSKLLSIILIGQEELVSFLKGNAEIREVSARLNIVQMPAIPNLVEDYLRHKIQRAGGRLEEIITDDGLKMVKTLLAGDAAIPISLNNLLAKSIEDGYLVNSLPVTAEIVETAYRKFNFV